MTRPRSVWLALGASLAAGAIGAAGVALAAARRRGGAEDTAEPTARGNRDTAEPTARGDRDDAETQSRRPPKPPSRRRKSPRAYRLGRGEPAGDGLRRIAVGRLDHAVDQLEGDGDPEAVHEARKDLKKLRAVLRLLRGRLGDELYRRENSSARETGRMLAGARDAQVRVETLTGLIESGAVDAAAVAELRELLERELGEGVGRVPADRAPAARISHARERARSWPVAGDGWDGVGPGLRRGYRRGRARMGEALNRPSVENLHEWRKRAKDLWYHLRILAPAWPPVLDALAAEAHALTERLGDDHDLAMLAAAARGHSDAFDGPQDLDALLDSIGRRRAELQAEAAAIGRRLYADEPKAFEERAKAWWRAWRSEPWANS